MALGINFDQSQALGTIKILERLPRQMTREIALAVRESAKEVAQETRRLLRRKRSRGGVVEASSPGKPPALRTGALAHSIGFRRVRRDGLAYVVEAREFYGKFLELGRAPRPFISLAMETKRDRIEARLVAAITRTLEDAARP